MEADRPAMARARDLGGRMQPFKALMNLLAVALRPE
jgi:hypothetical protein